MQIENNMQHRHKAHDRLVEEYLRESASQLSEFEIVVINFFFLKRSFFELS